jgi:hypothetical protein
MREEGIEPSGRVWKTRMLPFTSLPRVSEKGGAGLEPAASSFEATRSGFPSELTARVIESGRRESNPRSRRGMPVL